MAAWVFHRTRLVAASENKMIRFTVMYYVPVSTVCIVSRGVFITLSNANAMQINGLDSI